MKVLHYEVINKQKQYEEEKEKQIDVIQTLKNNLQEKTISVTQVGSGIQKNEQKLTAE